MSAIIERPDGALVQVGADAAKVLQLVDGGHDAAAIAERLGPPWTADVVDGTLRRLESAGLVGDPVAAPRRRRVRFVPPAAVQFTLFDDPARLNRLSVGWFVRRPFVIFQIVVALVGLGALATRGHEIVASATHPLPLAGVLGVVLLTVTLTSLHELAHALALIAYGGRVRRFGAMIFYGSIAFFCDITEAWRLRPRTAGRNVALAGGLMSCALAGLISLGSLVAPAAIAGYVALIAAMTFLAATVNLIPFVKFDGYVALVLAKGANNLRRNAMDAWVDALSGRRPRNLPSGWTRAGYLAFGACSSAFPLALVGLSAAQLIRILANYGQVGGLLQLAIVLLVAVIAIRQASSFVRRASERGLPRALAPGVLATVVLAAVSAGAVATVPRSTATPFAADGRNVWVVVDGLPSGERPVAGQTIRLSQSGLLGTRSLGTARVLGRPATRRKLPAQVLMPSVRIGGVVAKHAVLAQPARRLSAVGEAQLARGRESLLAHAARLTVTDALARALDG